MRIVTQLFKNSLEYIFTYGTILISTVMFSAIPLNAQSDTTVSPEIKFDETSAYVLINESMVENFNAVEYNDEQVGFQGLILQHDMEDVSIMLKTMSMEQISNATEEQLKNAVGTYKSNMDLNMVTVKPQKRDSGVASSEPISEKNSVNK